LNIHGHARPEIGFYPLKVENFPLMAIWLNEPDVHKWWGEGKQWSLQDVKLKYATYTKQYKEQKGERKSIYPYVITFHDKEIGYIQYYDAHDFPREDGDRLVELLKPLAAIDLFIGDPNFIRKGLGGVILDEFIIRFVWNRFDSCFVDPDLENKAAIRAYQKADFHGIKEVANTLWMYRNKHKDHGGG
jgi:aminoglycoside 6'-N-acetyltransferase